MDRWVLVELCKAFKKNTATAEENQLKSLKFKKIGVLGFASGFIFLAWYFRSHGYFDAEFLFEYIGRHPLLAPFIFILFHVLALLFMIPSLPLNLAAGMLWGPQWGSIITTVGGGLGAVIAFALARTSLGQPLARKFDNRIIGWLQEQLEIKGWRIVAFTRINPIFPSSLLNYIFGITSIRFTTYTWSSVVFMFFPALALSVIGHEIGDFIITGRAADIFRTVLIVSIVITSLIIMRIAFRIFVMRRYI